MREFVDLSAVAVALSIGAPTCQRPAEMALTFDFNNIATNSDVEAAGPLSVEVASAS